MAVKDVGVVAANAIAGRQRNVRDESGLVLVGRNFIGFEIVVWAGPYLARESLNGDPRRPDAVSMVMEKAEADDIPMAHPKIERKHAANAVDPNILPFAALSPAQKFSLAPFATLL